MHKHLLSIILLSLTVFGHTSSTEAEINQLDYSELRGLPFGITIHNINLQHLSKGIDADIGDSPLRPFRDITEALGNLSAQTPVKLIISHSTDSNFPITLSGNRMIVPNADGVFNFDKSKSYEHVFDESRQKSVVVLIGWDVVLANQVNTHGHSLVIIADKFFGHDQEIFTSCRSDNCRPDEPGTDTLTQAAHGQRGADGGHFVLYSNVIHSFHIHTDGQPGKKGNNGKSTDASFGMNSSNTTNCSGDNCVDCIETAQKKFDSAICNQGSLSYYQPSGSTPTRKNGSGGNGGNGGNIVIKYSVFVPVGADWWHYDRDEYCFLDSSCNDPVCMHDPSVAVCDVSREADNLHCNDGLDNDGDGYIDCNDEDCQYNPYVCVCHANFQDSFCRVEVMKSFVPVGVDIPIFVPINTDSSAVYYDMNVTSHGGVGGPGGSNASYCVKTIRFETYCRTGMSPGSKSVGSKTCYMGCASDLKGTGNGINDDNLGSCDGRVGGGAGSSGLNGTLLIDPVTRRHIDGLRTLISPEHWTVNNAYANMFFKKNTNAGGFNSSKDAYYRYYLNTLRMFGVLTELGVRCPDDEFAPCTNNAGCIAGEVCYKNPKGCSNCGYCVPVGAKANFISSICPALTHSVIMLSYLMSDLDYYGRPYSKPINPLESSQCMLDQMEDLKSLISETQDKWFQLESISDLNNYIQIISEKLSSEANVLHNEYLIAQKSVESKAEYFVGLQIRLSNRLAQIAKYNSIIDDLHASIKAKLSGGNLFTNLLSAVAKSALSAFGGKIAETLGGHIIDQISAAIFGESNENDAATLVGQSAVSWSVSLFGGLLDTSYASETSGISPNDKAKSDSFIKQVTKDVFKAVKEDKEVKDSFKKLTKSMLVDLNIAEPDNQKLIDELDSSKNLAELSHTGNIRSRHFVSAEMELMFRDQTKEEILREYLDQTVDLKKAAYELEIAKRQRDVAYMKYTNIKASKTKVDSLLYSHSDPSDLTIFDVSILKDSYYYLMLQYLEKLSKRNNELLNHIQYEFLPYDTNGDNHVASIAQNGYYYSIGGPYQEDIYFDKFHSLKNQINGIVESPSSYQKDHYTLNLGWTDLNRKALVYQCSDDDNDGWCDWNDPCPSDYNNLCIQCVDGIESQDDDGDGILNCADACRNDGNNNCHSEALDVTIERLNVLNWNTNYLRKDDIILSFRINEEALGKHNGYHNNRLKKRVNAIKVNIFTTDSQQSQAEKVVVLHNNYDIFKISNNNDTKDDRYVEFDVELFENKEIEQQYATHYGIIDCSTNGEYNFIDINDACINQTGMDSNFSNMDCGVGEQELFTLKNRSLLGSWQIIIRNSNKINPHNINDVQISFGYSYVN